MMMASREAVVNYMTPLGLAQTSYLPRPHAQPGWSVDHFTGERCLEPLTSTGATSVVLNSVDALHGDLGMSIRMRQPAVEAPSAA